MHILATGDTWGINGPAFLGFYATLTAAAVTAVVLARRSLARSHAPVPALRLDNPDDIAYLHGGPELAVLSALSAMHVAGRIAPAGRRCVQAVGVVDPAAGELERAVHGSTQHPATLAELLGVPLVSEALGRVERRLIDADLLLAARRRRHIRCSGWPLWVVAAIGAIWIATAEGEPVGPLAMLLSAALCAAMVSVTAPWRTDRGDAELSRLRTVHAHLSPQLRPDWRVYGPMGAALGVAVFGASALWAADPALAKELRTGHTLSVSISGEGGCGGCGG